MNRRDALFLLAAVALTCLAASAAIHPAIAPLCLLWLLVQRLIIEPARVRLPEVALALLHIWLGVVFLGFAFLGERSREGSMDMLELLLAFGAPFLLLKLVTPPARFHDAVAVLTSIVLVLGSAATAPGSRALGMLVAFLATLCWTVPVLVQREGQPEDSTRLRMVGRFASFAWLPHVAAGGLAIAGLLGGVALYVIVPRLEPKQDELESRTELNIRNRSQTRKESRSGFARTMKLGDIGRIKRDDRLAFEAQLTYYGRPFDPPPDRQTMLLFRARAWDRYDPESGEWRRGTGRPQRIGEDGWIEHGETPVDWRIRVHGYDGRTLFLPQRARRIRSLGVGLLRDPAGTIVSDEEMRAYGVEAGDPITHRVDLRRLEPDARLAAHLDVPATLRPALHKLLPADTAGLSTAERIGLVHRIFTQQGFRYTLDLPSTLPEEMDPIEAFVERREGHCELFASAGCLLLRVLGVPARIAGGMRLAEQVGPGHYAARYRNAHAWVEVPFREVGFVAVDFTPADSRAVTPSDQLASGAEGRASLGIDERGADEAGAGGRAAFDWGDPLRFSPDDQRRMRRRVGRLFLSLPYRELGAGALLLLVAVLARRARRRARRSPFRVHPPAGHAARAYAFYARWLKRCAHRGYPRHATQTPREFLAALPEPLRTEGAEITRRFETLRYDV